MKKDGGLIRNWQLHTLSVPVEKAKEFHPSISTDKVYKFTGTVVEDPTGRFEPGFHMTSSLVVKIDREAGTIETLNTIYRVQDEGNDTLPDMGDAILNIFY